MPTPDYLSGTDEIEPQDLITVWSRRNRDSRRVSFGQFQDGIDATVQAALTEPVESAVSSAALAQAAAEQASSVVAGAVQKTELSAVSGASLVNTKSTSTARVRTVEDKLRDFLNVDDFAGVDRTGSTDSSAGFAVADAAAFAAGKTLYGDGTYRLDSKTVLASDCDLWGATLVFPGTLPIALELSRGDAPNPTSEHRSRSQRIGHVVNNTKPTVGWDGQGIGVRGVNHLMCDVVVRSVTGFGVGMLATAYGTGFAYTKFVCEYSNNNMVNMRFQPGDALGYANEVIVDGGRYHHRATEGTNVAGTRHIQLLPFDASNPTASWPNNILFLKPSVEGDVAEYHIEISGDTNTFVQGRYESTAPKVLFSGQVGNISKTSKNTILGGYNADQIQFTVTNGTLGGELIHPRKSLRSGFGLNYAVRNTAGDASSSPVMRIFPSTKNLMAATSADTDWAANLFANGLEAKRGTDAAARLLIDFQNGRMYVGAGLVAPTSYIGLNPSNPGGYTLSGDIFPVSTNTGMVGIQGLRFQRVYSRDFYGDVFYFGETFTGVPSIRTYGTTPEGNLTTAVGSLVLRTNGGLGSTIYIKEANATSFGYAPLQGIYSGTTAQRPTATTVGFQYFDTTLGKPVWWKGAVWVDALGATV